MQKFFNFLAAVSFGVTSTIVAGGTFLYLNRGQVMENVKDEMMEQIKEQLPGLVDDILPEVEAPIPSGGGLPSGLPL